MKMTCYNCKNYIDTLMDPVNPDFHMHDWCKQWHRQLDAYALADQFEYDGPFCNDLETGDAFCYMFVPVDVTTKPDEWFANNKQQNIDSMISK